MKTAIIYATKHGCTAKCSHTLANEIETETEIINIEETSELNLDDYTTVIIGGSIHAGSVNKRIKKFIDKNLDNLSNKKLGLFLCCLFEGDVALKQFQEAFPEPLRAKALAHGLFGGELDFDKMNLIEKTIVKKVANVDESVSKINYNNIKEFAKQF